MTNEINRLLELSPFTIEDIRSSNRRRELVYWRHSVAYRLREQGYSYEKIGKYINRDHASVIFSVGKVEAALEGYNSQLLAIFRLTESCDTKEEYFCKAMEVKNVKPKKVRL
jgi:hypothetical protein